MILVIEILLTCWKSTKQRDEGIIKSRPETKLRIRAKNLD